MFLFFSDLLPQVTLSSVGPPFFHLKHNYKEKMKQKIHHNHKNIESKYQVTMRSGKFCEHYFCFGLQRAPNCSEFKNIIPGIIHIKTYFLGLSYDMSLVYFFFRLLLIQIENLYQTLSDEKKYQLLLVYLIQLSYFPETPKK